MKKIFCIATILLLTAFDGFSQEIKIGTIAPAGSAWETTLKEIAAEWTRISNGEIVVRIYSGGTVGEEEDIIRKIKLGRLHAAALSSQGIKSISNDLFALSVPMLVRDDSEFDYVFSKMRPVFDRELQKQGFVPLGWTNTGWVKWFTKTKVVYPDDLKQVKLAVDNADEKAIQIWQRTGFKVIPLAFSDTMSGIYSGMVDGTYITPYGANAIGLAEHARFMLDLPITPVYGLLTISERMWKRIDDRYKPMLIERTEEILARFYDRIMQIENEGLEIMKEKGLVVVPVPDEAKEKWETIVEEAVALYIEETITPSVYSEIKKYINEYRTRQ